MLIAIVSHLVLSGIYAMLCCAACVCEWFSPAIPMVMLNSRCLVLVLVLFLHLRLPAPLVYQVLHASEINALSISTF